MFRIILAIAVALGLDRCGSGQDKKGDEPLPDGGTDTPEDAYQPDAPKDIYVSDSPKDASGPDAPKDTSVPDVPAPQPNRAAVIESDFVTGNVRILNLDTRQFEPTAFGAHPDATLRHFGGRLYLVNRLGGDSVQCLDPLTGKTCSEEISVGAGTNPQDSAVPTDGIPYVSLYQPIEPGDVVRVNLETGAILARIDLVPFTNDDGDRNVRAAEMLLRGSTLYVLVQDLQSDYSVNTPGKVAVIDTETDTVETVIQLATSNPVSIRGSNDGQIYVASAGNFNPPDGLGGVEVVDPLTNSSSTVAFTDGNLGGSPGGLALLGENGFVISSFFDPVPGTFRSAVRLFSRTTNELSEATVYDSADFLQGLAASEALSLLLVPDRNPSAPGVVLVNPEGVVMGGPLSAEMPPSWVEGF